MVLNWREEASWSSTCLAVSSELPVPSYAVPDGSSGQLEHEQFPMRLAVGSF